MRTLFTDLDNTIIYSYKHDIGPDKHGVELYEGRTISFVSERTRSLLHRAAESLSIVPLSTRSIEQYNRIDLGIGALKWALVCNGGVLLERGRKNEEWYRESLDIARSSGEAMQKAAELLEKDQRRSFELRFIEDLFLFTKCSDGRTVAEELADILDPDAVSVHSLGEKVYVVPIGLDKGSALRRFARYTGQKDLMAAGDSDFDVPMIREADIGIVPRDFCERYGVKGENIFSAPADVLFSEFVLETALQEAEQAPAG